MNAMKLSMNPIAKLRRVFTVPKMFHKENGASARSTTITTTSGSNTDCPSSRTPRQMSRRFSSKLKRAMSWRPRHPRRFYRSRRELSPQQISGNAVSVDISRRGPVYVADVSSLRQPQTHGAQSKSNENFILSRSRSLPNWKTENRELQILPTSGPMLCNFHLLSPK